jgi:hypothetical protein
VHRNWKNVYIGRMHMHKRECDGCLDIEHCELTAAEAEYCNGDCKRTDEDDNRDESTKINEKVVC